MKPGSNPLSTSGRLGLPMESFLQKLAKKREDERPLTILPVVESAQGHGAACDCGEAGCGGDEAGCCGG